MIERVRAMKAAHDRHATAQKELREAEKDLREHLLAGRIRNVLASLDFIEHDPAQGIWRMVFTNAGGETHRLEMTDDVKNELAHYEP